MVQFEFYAFLVTNTGPESCQSFLKILMLVKYILASVNTGSFVLFTGWKLPVFVISSFRTCK